MENDTQPTVIDVPSPMASTQMPAAPTAQPVAQPAREIKIKIPQVEWSQVKALLPKNMVAQSKLTVMGLAVPAYLVWLASYFAFSVAPVTGALNGRDLEGMGAFQRLFIGLGFAGGILYVLLGVATLVLAFWLYRRAFGVYGLRDLQIGQLRLESAVHGFLAFVALIFVSTLVLTVLQINPEALNLIGSFASFFN